MRHVAENLRGVVVLLGAGWMVYGVAGWSVPAAHVTGGALLLAGGLLPYLRMMRGR